MGFGEQIQGEDCYSLEKKLREQERRALQSGGLVEEAGQPQKQSAVVE